MLFVPPPGQGWGVVSQHHMPSASPRHQVLSTFASLLYSFIANLNNVGRNTRLISHTAPLIIFFPYFHFVSFFANQADGVDATFSPRTKKKNKWRGVQGHILTSMPKSPPIVFIARWVFTSMALLTLLTSLLDMAPASMLQTKIGT